MKIISLLNISNEQISNNIYAVLTALFKKMYIIDIKKLHLEVNENGVITQTRSTRNRGMYNFVIKSHTYL